MSIFIQMGLSRSCHTSKSSHSATVHSAATPTRKGHKPKRNFSEKADSTNLSRLLDVVNWGCWDNDKSLA